MDKTHFRADLHTHSTFSDGELAPQDLLIKAKKANLSGLSITDHDAVFAYHSQTMEEAKRLGLELITGVEFSCRYQEFPVHILGYCFDPYNQAIIDLCHRHHNRREERNQMILERLKGRGIAIDYEEVKSCGYGTIGRPHIAEVLRKRRIVSSIQEAFEQFLGDDKGCYVPGFSVSVEETIDVIHQAKGKAFLAHPHLIKQKKITSRIVDLGLDGIEVYYARLPKQQEAVWLAMAKEKGLLISGGSDFHGDFKTHNPLGASWVDWEAFQQICAS